MFVEIKSLNEILAESKKANVSGKEIIAKLTLAPIAVAYVEEEHLTVAKERGLDVSNLKLGYNMYAIKEVWNVLTFHEQCAVIAHELQHTKQDLQYQKEKIDKDLGVCVSPDLEIDADNAANPKHMRAAICKVLHSTVRTVIAGRRLQGKGTPKTLIREIMENIFDSVDKDEVHVQRMRALTRRIKAA